MWRGALWPASQPKRPLFIASNGLELSTLRKIYTNVWHAPYREKFDFRVSAVLLGRPGLLVVCTEASGVKEAGYYPSRIQEVTT